MSMFARFDDTALSAGTSLGSSDFQREWEASKPIDWVSAELGECAELWSGNQRRRWSDSLVSGRPDDVQQSHSGLGAAAAGVNFETRGSRLEWLVGADRVGLKEA